MKNECMKEAWSVVPVSRNPGSVIPSGLWKPSEKELSEDKAGWCGWLPHCLSHVL